MKPNRKQFAKIVADAYFSQYGSEQRRRRVMNNPAIDFNTDNGKFRWCSSLTPSGETEIRVDELEAGLFGDFNVDDKNAEKSLSDYIANDADDYWNDIIEKIGCFGRD